MGVRTQGGVKHLFWNKSINKKCNKMIVLHRATSQTSQRITIVDRLFEYSGKEQQIKNECNIGEKKIEVTELAYKVL